MRKLGKKRSLSGVRECWQSGKNPESRTPNPERRKKALVTGSAGYLGSVMVPVLVAAGHEVVGLDSGYFEGCDFGEKPVSIPSLRKDIRDVTLGDLRGFDAVIHLAALCNDPLGDLNPDWTHEINHLASVRLAILAREAGIKRFLYASSCSLYGASGDELLTEDAPLRPLTPYALSKVRTEEALVELADSDFSPVFMRNATAYGVSPRFRADLVLNNLACWAFTTGKVRIMSEGTAWRPLVHVGDIARAFAAALVAPREAVHNEAFNVGVQGENYQVRELAWIVQQTVPGCVIEYTGESGRDARNYRVDFSKIAKRLPSFQPKWNAWLGAGELYSALRQVGLTLEEFQGRKYTRLNQLKYLIETRRLDDTLRWRDLSKEEVA